MEATLVKSPDRSIVVHAWDHDRFSKNPQERIPKDYVSRMSKGMRLGYHGTPSWHQIFVGEEKGSINIVVAGDLLAEDLRAVAVYAIEFERMIRDEVGGEKERRPYHIKAFRDRKKFTEYATKAGAANAMSYYDPRKSEIVTWFDGTISHSNLQELVSHEFTHAYMDNVWDCTSPLWFAEGMAEYFQNFDWIEDEAIGGGFSETEAGNLKASELVPLPQFVKLPRETMYGPLFSGLYAQAWAVVRFLFDRDEDIILDLLERKPIDVTHLSKEFEEYARSL